MICPNCGSNMSDKKKRCERCGTDLTICKRILEASNQYYNNGLARAKVRDLSGAVIALRNGLELNKSNINARNLLGLVYYEMGETVAALSEWVISKYFKPENNEADEYINRVQSNLTKLDNLNQAIKRYNTALNFAKQGSDDLAIIQLKKVTLLNPHFIRAYHLLSLLLMKSGDKERARKCLLKAMKIDVTNTMTLRYLRELEEPVGLSKDLEGNPEAEHSVTSSIMPISSYKEDKPNIMAFVNLVIGIVIGVAAMAFLVIPTIKKNLTTGENADYVDNSAGMSQMAAKDETINSLQQDNDDLQLEVNQLQTQIDNAVIPEDNSALYDPLFEATRQYMLELSKENVDERDFTAVADLLESIDESQYGSEVSVQLLTRLREEIYPIVTLVHYEKGHSLYSNEKYNEALPELLKAVVFARTNVDAIYFTGRTYHQLADMDKAAIYYNMVITDYPDSRRAADAQSYLNEIQQ